MLIMLGHVFGIHNPGNSPATAAHFIDKCAASQAEYELTYAANGHNFIVLSIILSCSDTKERTTHCTLVRTGHFGAHM